MIDTESEPGAWEREMAQGPKCLYCKHYRYEYMREPGHMYHLTPSCNLGKRLVPCSEYEREPGADG